MIGRANVYHVQFGPNEAKFGQVVSPSLADRFCSGFGTLNTNGMRGSPDCVAHAIRHRGHICLGSWNVGVEWTLFAGTDPLHSHVSSAVFAVPARSLRHCTVFCRTVPDPKAWVKRSSARSHAVCLAPVHSQTLWWPFQLRRSLVGADGCPPAWRQFLTGMNVCSLKKSPQQPLPPANPRTNPSKISQNKSHKINPTKSIPQN